jgi:protein TonB
MSRYFSSFFIALGFYVLFGVGFFYFLKSNKIIIQEPKTHQLLSLNHIELEASIPKSVIEETIVKDIQENIQEEKIDELIEQEVEEKAVIEKKIEQKIIDVPKPIIKKEIKKEIKEKVKKVEKKIEKNKKIQKKEILKKEENSEQNIEKKTENNTEQKTIQIEKPLTNQITSNQQTDDKKVYLDKHLIQIRNLINQNVKYPRRARKLSIEGIVIVQFKITENGSVENITIIDGHKFLQSATIEAIVEASKSFPKTNKSIEIQIPIEYKLI